MGPLAELLPWLNVLVLPLAVSWVRHAVATERRLTAIETKIDLTLGKI